MVSSNQKYRIEKDSMGSVRVPKESYYGAQTQRAVENFPVSGWRFQKEMIMPLALSNWPLRRRTSVWKVREVRSPGSHLQLSIFLIRLKNRRDAHKIIRIFKVIGVIHKKVGHSNRSEDEAKGK